MPVIPEDFGHSFVVCEARLGADLNGYQLRAAPRSFDRFDSILGGKSSHDQRQLTVGCHLNGGSINPLHILGFEGTSTIHFHYKLRICHSVLLLSLYADLAPPHDLTNERLSVTI